MQRRPSKPQNRRLGVNRDFFLDTGKFRLANLHSQRQILERFFKIWEAALPADMQMTALADMIQAALMLNYNDRKVG